MDAELTYSMTYDNCLLILHLIHSQTHNTETHYVYVFYLMDLKISYFREQKKEKKWASGCPDIVEIPSLWDRSAVQLSFKC